MDATSRALPEPLFNVVGDAVALGPLRRDLLPLYLKWINDFEIGGNLGIPMRPMTWEAEEAWYERVHQDEHSVDFTIYERATRRPIGNTGLHRIDQLNRTAEFGILIGEKDCWGKGYGTETTRLMLDYGFTVLGLHAVMLRVFSYNQRGVRAYTKAGFKEVGRLREAKRLGDRFYDVILMDCLATEFTGAALQRLRPEA